MLICQQCRGDHFAPTFPYTSARARSDRIDTICGVEERGVEKQGMQPPSEGGGGKELEFVKSLLLAFCVAIAHVVKHTHTHNQYHFVAANRVKRVEDGGGEFPLPGAAARQESDTKIAYISGRAPLLLPSPIALLPACVCVSGRQNVLIHYRNV